MGLDRSDEDCGVLMRSGSCCTTRFRILASLRSGACHVLIVFTGEWLEGHCGSRVEGTVRPFEELELRCLRPIRKALVPGKDM